MKGDFGGKGSKKSSEWEDVGCRASEKGQFRIWHPGCGFVEQKSRYQSSGMLRRKKQDEGFGRRTSTQDDTWQVLDSITTASID